MSTHLLRSFTVNNEQFQAMAQHMGNTVGETASYQRHAGYSDAEITEWRERKDREDDAFMRSVE